MCRVFNKRHKQLSKTQKELKKALKKNTSIKRSLSTEEQLLIEEIQSTTKILNLNNLTRTMAYLDFYLEHPEIHWSFLAHMVSRNAGWNMTDLKGEYLPRILTEKEIKSFFNFIERGNWLIFQDAFPQLLLYEKSIQTGINLFYLLPHLNVSVFMEPIWNQFLEYRDSYTLTVALIINEQSYIESRVIENNRFKEDVLNTFEFKLQDLLSMNHILFPSSNDTKTKLTGQTVRHFDSLDERILLGKRLYSILFSMHHLPPIEKWAKQTIHTGSRKDYWPHLFNDIAELAPGSELKPRLQNCKLTKGTPRIYSPALASVWENQQHEPASPGDWYKDWDVLHYMAKSEEKVNGDIEGDYCKTVERLEMVALSTKLIQFLDKD
ncbi:DUF2515 domain-containing protein [Bacillus luteolus]|uniref:DUF2515 domain-containing protein n=1 Tax=Litchfieldia luteola TaxID=682179 RepID=A0ABR9QIW5_9BACI|nr:DUF2515 domain-containing protein [Cytobacillus luteolus]MBE4908440.1 DUF2515 domain-containing protein [Cytobacillus luteolus]MBP1941286.1 hypothetical protein [Cytobacillus luteolus]